MAESERMINADEVEPELRRISERMSNLPYLLQGPVARFLANIQALIITQHEHIARGAKSTVLYDGDAKFYQDRFSEIISSGILDPKASPKKEIR